MTQQTNSGSTTTYLSFGFLWWLGGAMWVYNQPGYGFWDALIWVYYVGRFVASHFAQLHTP